MIFNLLKTGYQKVKSVFKKTGSLLGTKLRSLFSKGIDEITLEQLEQLFYEADLGVKASVELTEKVQELYRKNPKLTSDDIIAEIKQDMTTILKELSPSLTTTEQVPQVILIVGVNGNGKTTSTAKLANHFIQEGKKVLIAAADTFRAAAIDQLEIWAGRLNIDIVKGKPGSDPAAVTFDALEAAKARGIDVVIVDTAGRLHTKTDLMEELKKIRRTCHKVHPNSPHETLLVLDATAGQNAIDQAKIFHEYSPISGLFLAKLDGTAKGGIVFSIQQQLKIPVKFIGLGENIEDIEPFEAESFVNALFD